MPCSTCKFSAPTAKAGTLSCKRFPPVINPSNPCQPPQSVFPTLLSTDGCGEFQMAAAMTDAEVRDRVGPVGSFPPPPKRGFFGRLIRGAGGA